MMKKGHLLASLNPGFWGALRSRPLTIPRSDSKSRYTSLAGQVPDFDCSLAKPIKKFRDGIVAVGFNGFHGSLGPYRDAAKTMLALKGEKMDGEFRAGFDSGESISVRPRSHAPLRRR